jgi:hypothetical protein
MSKKNPGIERLCKDFLLIKETDPEVVDFAVKNELSIKPDFCTYYPMPAN